MLKWMWISDVHGQLLPAATRECLVKRGGGDGSSCRDAALLRGSHTASELAHRLGLPPAALPKMCV